MTENPIPILEKLLFFWMNDKIVGFLLLLFWFCFEYV